MREVSTARKKSPVSGFKKINKLGARFHRHGEEVGL